MNATNPGFSRSPHMIEKDSQKRLNKLWEKLTKEAPELFPSAQKAKAWFDSTYCQKTRFFHDEHHLLEMCTQGSQDLRDPEGVNYKVLDDIEAPHNAWAENFYAHWADNAYSQLFEALSKVNGKPLPQEDAKWLRKINLIAAVAHDAEYHVDGKITEANRKILEQYVKIDENGQATAIKDEGSLMPSSRDNNGFKMILKMFNLKPGQKLDIYNGKNEFLSALAVEHKLYNRVTTETLLGIITSIYATCPFKNPADYSKMVERLEDIYRTDPTLRAMWPHYKGRVNMLAGAATLLANQDVAGLLGGRKPFEALNYYHVRHSYEGAWRLIPEEGSPRLQAAVRNGTHSNPPMNILQPTFKRVRLNKLLDRGDNLFHSVVFSSNDCQVEYPDPREVEALNFAASNKSGTGVCDVVDKAFRARVGALAIVHAIAANYALNNVPLRQLMGIADNSAAPWGHTGKRALNRAEEMAIKVLNDTAVSDGGTVNGGEATIAAALIQSLSKVQLGVLYEAAEKNFGVGKKGGAITVDDSSAFLKQAGHIVGQDTISKITGIMAHALRNNGHAVESIALEKATVSPFPQKDVPYPDADGDSPPSDPRAGRFSSTSTRSGLGGSSSSKKK